MQNSNEAIEVVRIALRDGSDPGALRAGIVACRCILATLETATERAPTSGAASEGAVDAAAAAPVSALAGDPALTGAPVSVSAPVAPGGPEPGQMGAAVGAASPVPGAAAPAGATLPIDPASIAALVSSLGTLPPEQLLDLAIARLRAALPPGTAIPSPSPLKFQLIPIQHLRGAR